MNHAIIRHLVQPAMTENSPLDRRTTEITCELPQDTNIQDLIPLGNLDLEGELGWEISLLREFLSPHLP